MTLKRRTPLKRTPMKPGKSTLKRSGRIKSTPVSQRKGRDVEVIREYMAAHPYCEFERHGTYTGEDGHQCIAGFEPHHSARIKVDDPRILLSLCTACHQLHDIHDPSFVVLCLWTKLQTGYLDRECFEFYSRKFRGGNIVSYIQRGHEWIDEGIIEMRDAVVAHAGFVGYWEAE